MTTEVPRSDRAGDMVDASRRPWAGPRILGVPRNAPVLALLVLGTADALIAATTWAALCAGPRSGAPAGSVAALMITVLATQLAAGAATGLYLRRVLIGSAAEMRLLGLTSVVAFVAALLVDLLAGLDVPILSIISAWLLTLVLALALRHVVRLVLDRQRLPRGSTPVIVVGAGSVGMSVVDQMLRDRNGVHVPVGFLDDDPFKQAFRYRGVRVLGDVDHAAEVLRSTRAEGLVIAVGHPVPDLFANLAEQVADSDVWVRTVPSASELLDGITRTGASFLREIEVTDLIGRAPSPPDVSSARSLIQGHRVLVTGAGGSIGSELCRQIAALDPEELVMLDRDESALHELQLSLTQRALLDTPDLALADIRDPASLDAVFELHRPEIVFHTAALKHLPLLESHPQEAWKSNVHGTQNVIDAADRHGVETFVNVSTDKAARPTSELGRTKRIAEGLTASAAARTGSRYMSVRFGNVIGSRGSAVPAFAEQIRQGGPVTITHAQVTRFFMTIPEACALVLFAASVGEAGETMVLDLGEPVRIHDIARRLMLLLNRPCQIVYTGLRPGEKLHEELISPDESEITRRHDGVYHVKNPGIDPRVLPVPSASLDLIRAFEKESLQLVSTPAREAHTR